MTPALRIRPAVPADAGRLSALALRSKAHWGYPRTFMQACVDELTVLPEAIQSPTLHTEVAEKDGETIGFYALERISGTGFELDALFVEPASIGTGVGRALFTHALGWAAANGGRSLLIQSDPNAQDFYRACGAERIGERESASIPGRLLPLFSITLGARPVSTRGRDA